MVWATPPGGERLPVGDLGRFDWLAQLLANQRARFLAGGIGRLETGSPQAGIAISQAR